MERVLAFTPTFGGRRSLAGTINDARRNADYPFDWHVFCGRPTPGRARELEAMQDRGAIQGYTLWAENRGQHHATRAALEAAESGGYHWLLRIDDDISFPTKRWLRKLLGRMKDMRDGPGHGQDLYVGGPDIRGLQYPPQPVGWQVVAGETVELMAALGGGVRIHPVALFEGFEADVYAQMRRTDPDQIANWVVGDRYGALVRFPEIRVKHHTRELEAQDGPDEAHERQMGLYWCYLGEGC